MGRSGIGVRGSFALKLLVTVALIAVGDVLFFQRGQYGGAFGLYGLALIAGVVIVHPAVVRTRPAAAALALASLYAIAMTYAPSPLAWCLFWIAAALAILLPRFGGFDDSWRWGQRILLHGLAALVGPLRDAARMARIRRERKSGGRAQGRLLAALALPVFGTATFVWLFAAANPVIEQWVLALNLPSLDFSTIGRIGLWLVLLWLIWGLMRPHVTRFVFGTFDGTGELSLPGVTTRSVLLSLLSFNALFLVQNSMDAAWLWGLAPLPEGITLAGYAHRGAYPLIATALLAAIFVLVALRPGSESAGNRAIRRLVTLWIVQNLFLVFNAALRTIDYVEAYSLTVLRIVALLWMVLVAVGLVLVLWRMLRAKSPAWLINANVSAAGVLLTAICFVDLGAVAAQWNVRHAREIDGDGATLDLCYLNSLGGSALLPLIELEQRRLPAAFALRVGRVRQSIHTRLVLQVDDGGWDWLSGWRLRLAEERLGADARLASPLPPIRCDGRILPPAPTVAPAQPTAPALTGTAEQ